MIEFLESKPNSLPTNDFGFNKERIGEFLEYTKIDSKKYIATKYCLDAGCGNGRYTYAMQKLGAMRVDSFDICSEEVAKCRDVNPDAISMDILDLEPLPRPIYDFVLCYGFLSRVTEPRKAFSKIVTQVSKSNGILHIMVYHRNMQKVYDEVRKIWQELSFHQQLKLCEEKVKKYGGTVNDWFYAFNSEHFWSFSEEEVRKWFEEDGFSEIKPIVRYNINMRGQLS